MQEESVKVNFMFPTPFLGLALLVLYATQAVCNISIQTPILATVAEVIVLCFDIRTSISWIVRIFVKASSPIIWLGSGDTDSFEVWFSRQHFISANSHQR